MQTDDYKEPDTWPKLSVVIPIRNEERFIEQTIGYIQDQDYPEEKIEILVVDGESDDRSAEIVNMIAARDGRVKLLNNSKRLSSAARNIGARNATGEIVLYIDGHVYIDNPFLLKNVARLMREKKVSVLSRPGFQDIPGNRFFQKAVALGRKSAFGHGPGSSGFSDESKYVNPESTGTYYRREVIEAAGYFDENFDAAEDFEFNYRLGRMGYESYTAPDLIIYYFPRENFSQLFHQMKRYGIGRCRIVWKHPVAFSIAVLIPAAFVVGLPVLLLLSLWIPQTLPAAIVIYGLYLLVSLLVSARISFKSGWRYMIALPGIFLAIHAGLGWGIIREAGRQLLSKLWSK